MTPEFELSATNDAGQVIGVRSYNSQMDPNGLILHLLLRSWCRAGATRVSLRGNPEGIPGVFSMRRDVPFPENPTPLNRAEMAGRLMEITRAFEERAKRAA